MHMLRMANCVTEIPINCTSFITQYTFKFKVMISCDFILFIKKIDKKDKLCSCY